jgi:hypothetical protein
LGVSGEFLELPTNKFTLFLVSCLTSHISRLFCHLLKQLISALYQVCETHPCRQEVEADIAHDIPPAGILPGTVAGDFIQYKPCDKLDNKYPKGNKEYAQEERETFEMPMYKWKKDGTEAIDKEHPQIAMAAKPPIYFSMVPDRMIKGNCCCENYLSRKAQCTP